MPPPYITSFDFEHRSPMRRWAPLALFFLPALLFIPVLYYSLTTPFALVDDYGMCYYVEFLDNPQRFQKWFDQAVLHFSWGRYRPLFDLYNMATWKLFGPNPWLHHLMRWMVHFGAVFFFAAASLRIAKSRPADPFDPLSAFDQTPHLLPLAVLVYVWLFFPNSPASRLGPQEVLTVFFLGLSSWMIARLITTREFGNGVPATVVTYVVLYLSYLGLSWSKEINIAVMLWIALFFYLMTLPGFRWRRMIAGVPLLLIFIYTLQKVYIASHNAFYGTAPLTPQLLLDNAAWLLDELFLTDTSPVLSSIFAFSLGAVVVWATARLLRRDMDGETLFVLFLLGQFVSLFLILCTSWAPVLRYWYILIPASVSLLAFSVRLLLRFAKRYDEPFRRLSAFLVACPLLFFIGCNYYNFLLQTVAQHSIRNAEKQLIKELTRLHDDGAYIQILQRKNDPEGELVAHLIAYFRRFSPRFYDKTYQVHTAPPQGDAQPAYLVTMHEQHGDLDIHRVIVPETDYFLLARTRQLAGLLQGKPPRVSKDAGVHLLANYRWIIYKTGTERSAHQEENLPP